MLTETNTANSQQPILQYHNASSFGFLLTYRNKHCVPLWSEYTGLLRLQLLFFLKHQDFFALFLLILSSGACCRGQRVLQPHCFGHKQRNVSSCDAVDSLPKVCQFCAQGHVTWFTWLHMSASMTTWHLTFLFYYHTIHHTGNFETEIFTLCFFHFILSWCCLWMDCVSQTHTQSKRIDITEV